MAEPADAAMPQAPPDEPAAAAEPAGPAPDDQFLSMVDQVARNVQEEDNKYAVKAWICLDRDAFPRRQCIAVVENVWFDRTILSLIGLNCLTMILFASPIVQTILDEANVTADEMENYSLWAARHWTFPMLRPLGDCSLEDNPCSFSQWVDLIFLTLFFCEMVIKMLASGLMLHPHAYLRSSWNWLDFTVVLVGILDLFMGGVGALNPIRLVKTLRPLRSMNRIRGLRVLVQCIGEALPQMMNVGVFLIFTLILFGLFGHAFFHGKLRHACHTWNGEEWENTGMTCDAECQWDDMEVTLLHGRENNYTCASLGENTYQMERQKHPWRWTYSCRRGEQCRCAESGEATPWCEYTDNPNYGITNFDSLPWAMVSLFQAISLEGWVDMMYQLMDGCSMFVILYFIALVLFGSIVVMNLFLAVLCDNFEMADRDGDPEEKEEDPEEMTKREMEKLSHDSKFRQMCLELVRYPHFDFFIQGCILLNTALMCAKAFPTPDDDLQPSIPGSPQWDYLPMGYWFFLTSMNILLTAIFTAETLIKVSGLGWDLYKKDNMNTFDAFVVIFSIIEIGLELNSKVNTDAAELPLPLSVLRAFRIFRLFKLVRSIETLRKILVTLASSIKSVAFLAMLLLLAMLIFILLGVELFGGRYPHAEYNYTQDVFPVLFETMKMGDLDGSAWGDASFGSRYNFDDFGSAFLSIFVVLSGENWNEIMFDSHRATWMAGGATDDIPFAILYFLLLFVVGNLLLFNLFIAILLSNFEDDEDAEDEEAGDLGEESLADDGSVARKEKKDDEELVYRFGAYRPTKDQAALSRKSSSADAPASEAENEPEAAQEKIYPESVEAGKGDKSLKLLGWDNPLRLLCSKIMTHRHFEPVVLVLIIVSTILLIIDMPHLSGETPLRAVISVFNLIFIVLFTLEMIVKIIACGFISSITPKEYLLAEPYLHSGWNILDFLIVIISILSLAFPMFNSLRAFRAIRPMRLVSRYESLKITFQTLLQSVPAMGSLMTVALLFFCIFGILGLELFGGKFGYCMDPLYGDLDFGSRVMPGLGANDQTDYEECMRLPRYNLTRRTTDGILMTDMAEHYRGAWLDFVEYPQWLYPQFGSFDNIIFSLMLLFEVSALEGWPDVMHWAMDTDGSELYIQPWRIDTNPNDWGNPTDWAVSSEGRAPPSGVPTDRHVTSNIEAGIFFILWIIFGCFVIVNMTVGVVVDTFSRIKQENDGLLMMTEEAADWVKAQKQVLAQRPLKAETPPTQPWRLNFYYLVTSTKFEIFIMVIILLNMLQMACDWWEPVDQNGDPTYMHPLKQTMAIINYLFFAIYVIEMGLKWIGLGMAQYFKNPWNMFDFVLVIISLVDIIVSQGDGEMPFPAAVVRCLRLFRVARILRIVKTAKQLRTIILTVYISLPQLTNILVLMTLIIVVTDMLLVNVFFAVNYTPGYFSADSYNRNWTVTEYVEGARTEERYYENDWHFDSTPATNWGDSINRHANFAYFWTGALTLVRSSTGESFNNLMHDLYGWRWGHNRLTCCEECGPITDDDRERSSTMFIYSTGVTVNRRVPIDSCGQTILAFFIYFIYQMVMAYIVLSIMIGIILENFTNVGSETKKIRMEDLEDFREVWLKYDPKGTFVVPSHNLLAILQQLKAPLGIQGITPALSRADMLMHLGKLDIPDHSGYIHFVETLSAVSNEASGRVPVPVCETTNKMAKATLKVPGIQKLDRAAHSALTNYLVSLLQSRWRGYAMRKMYTGDEAAGADGAPPSGAYEGKVKPNQVAPGPAIPS